MNLATIYLEGKALELFQGYEVGIKNLNWKVSSADVW